MPDDDLGGRAIRRRRAQRDALWADSKDVVYEPAVGGWARIPRTIPLVATLADLLAGKKKPGRLYLTLWSYEFGDGYIEVGDPASIGFEAGYAARRAARSFTERVSELREIGLVRTAPLGVRECGFILLLDPHRVVMKLRERKPQLIPEQWWTAFVARCSAAGIPLDFS